MLTRLIILAAASTLASPIPADSLSKKANHLILHREPEIPDLELEILAREPEDVEAREPSPCVGTKCGY